MSIPPLRRRGFTLVELLVVIAIIVTLASLLFVAMAKVNQAAQSAKTLSRLREIGVASGGYMADNNMFYPPCWNNTEGANRSYAQLLDEYLHGRTPYRELDSKFIGPNARLPVKVNEYSHPITFSMNFAVCPDVTQYGDVARNSIHATQIERVSDIILMADGCQNPGNLNQANASAYRVYSAVGDTGPIGQFDQKIPVGPDEDSSRGDGWFRYPGGKCHALMCDGSSRAFPKGTITKGNLWIDKVR
ncbi:MAG: type II secretion system protein [Akkermansiaceae bacterium]|nr:type II secretion system protein [Akkermansiaceae bacterium]